MILIAGLSLVVVSCYDTDDEDRNNLSPSEMIHIGEAHNTGLAIILSKMQMLSKTRAPFVLREDIDSLIIDTVRDLTDLDGLSDEIKQEVYAYLDEIVREGASEEAVESMNPELTALQESFAMDLDAVLTDDDDDLISLSQRISSIEARAKNQLVGQDLEAVLAGCHVAAYTVQYWHDNAYLWVEAVGQPLTRANFSWKKVGRMDVICAIGAGFGALGAKLFAAGPIGWKAWAGWVFGAAVAGSASSMIEQIWTEEDLDQKVE